MTGVLHLENPLTPGPRTKALRVVAWSAAPGSVRDVDSSSTITPLLNLRKNTARHGRPLTIPARYQGLGARHGDIIGLGRRHQLHIDAIFLIRPEMSPFWFVSHADLGQECRSFIPRAKKTTTHPSLRGRPELMKHVLCKRSGSISQNAAWTFGTFVWKTYSLSLIHI